MIETKETFARVFSKWPSRAAMARDLTDVGFPVSDVRVRMWAYRDAIPMKAIPFVEAALRRISASPESSFSVDPYQREKVQKLRQEIAAARIKLVRFEASRLLVQKKIDAQTVIIRAAEKALKEIGSTNP